MFFHDSFISEVLYFHLLALTQIRAFSGVTTKRQSLSSLMSHAKIIVNGLIQAVARAVAWSRWHGPGYGPVVTNRRPLSITTRPAFVVTGANKTTSENLSEILIQTWSSCPAVVPGASQHDAMCLLSAAPPPPPHPSLA